MEAKRLWPAYKEADNELKGICYFRANELYDNNIPEAVSERIDWELSAIKRQGNAFAFIILRNMLMKCNISSEFIQLAGFAGNSFVAYLIGLCDFNPLDYSLSPFPAFGYDKEKMLDLVVYIPDRLQKEVYKTAGESGYRIVRCAAGDDSTFDIHPGGFFYVPDEVNIEEYSDIIYQDGEMVAIRDFHELKQYFYKQDILPHEDLQKLYDLYNSIDNYEEISPDQIYRWNDLSNGIKYFEYYVKLASLKHSSKKSQFEGNSYYPCDEPEKIYKYNKLQFDDVISNVDDVYEYLLRRRVDERTACMIAEQVRKGRLSDKDISVMRDYGVDEEYITACINIKYLFPRAHIISLMLMRFRLNFFDTDD